MLKDRLKVKQDTRYAHPLYTTNSEAPHRSAGKYNKIASEETGLGRAAAFEAARKDFPALSSWSDDEIEATYTLMKSTPSEILFQSPIGPFFLLSGLAIWRDGLSAWGIPPCREYLDFCQSIPSIQLFGS